MDFDVQRCTRRCAATGRELADGETLYSVLVRKGAEIERLDFASDAWPQAVDGAIGWWKSQVPKRDARKPQQTPSETLLDYFLGLAEQPERQDVRYVLALWLVRRRIVRLEESRQDERGELLVLFCPRDESLHEVRGVALASGRAEEIQQELGQLLFAPSK